MQPLSRAVLHSASRLSIACSGSVSLRVCRSILIARSGSPIGAGGCTFIERDRAGKSSSCSTCMAALLHLFHGGVNTGRNASARSCSSFIFPARISCRIASIDLFSPNSHFLPTASWLLWLNPCWCQQNKSFFITSDLICRQLSAVSHCGTRARQRGMSKSANNCIIWMKLWSIRPISSARKKIRTGRDCFSAASKSVCSHWSRFPGNSVCQREEGGGFMWSCSNVLLFTFRPAVSPAPRQAGAWHTANAN